MRETLQKLRLALRPIYGNRETEAIIKIVFHHLKGWNTVDMIMHEPEPLSPFMKGEVEAILRRLLNHEPIQYITGEARFHGFELSVNPSVLIPRPETEELVDIITDTANDRPDLRVLDIGTGSGCIAIALARTLRFPQVTAIDISPEALDTARKNAALLKTSIRFIQSDILHNTPSGKYDIVVSNPPYIDESEKKDMDDNVLLHEPHAALFVPDDNPLLFYHRILLLSGSILAPGGYLFFEINPRHAKELASLASSCGMADVEIIKDSFGKDRFLKSRKPCR